MAANWRPSAMLRARAAGGFVQHLTLFIVVSALAGVLVAGLVLPIIGGIGLAARSSADNFEDLPSELETPPLPQRSRILAADGSTLATFYYENRISVPLAKVAPVMRRAVLAIEDSRFYDHGGIDLRGTMRALISNTQSGYVQQGGSTLTQQYVKNVLIEAAGGDKAKIEAARAQTISRKLRELRYAITLEEKYTKDEILERYLNIAYFGSGAYGIEAAARHYFDKRASKLTLREAATLAGVVKQPYAYDPTRNPRLAKERRNIVLRRMADIGDITERRAERATKAKLGLDVTEVPNGCSRAKAQLFCDYVINVLENDKVFGKTREDRRALLYRGGLTIRTTLDWKTQRAAQRAIDDYTNPKDAIAAAIAMMEPGTGKVMALAQNHEWGDKKRQTKINLAADYGPKDGNNGFQAGSTFKVFVLAAAIDMGLPITTQIYSPSEVPIGDIRHCDGVLTDDYSPKNSTGSGTFDMRTGIAMSINTYWVQMQQRTGLCKPLRLAERMGVHRADGAPIRPVKSWTLGVDLVTPLTMAEAFATFAARGKHCDPVAITQVVDQDGKELDVPRARCEQVLDPVVADAVNSLLAGVIDDTSIPGRTGARMTLGRDAAGKTGTTNSNYAIWFSGYTPDLAASVWVGYPKASRSLENVTVGGTYYSSLCGGCLPGPIWQRAMLSALSDVPPSSFVPPDPTKIKGTYVTVPYVVGRSPEDAIAILRDVGLFGVVDEKRIKSDVAEGLVARTEPGVGGSAASGQSVVIYLSNGVKPKPDKKPGDGGNGNGGGDGGGGNGGGGGGGGGDDDKPKPRPTKPPGKPRG